MKGAVSSLHIIICDDEAMYRTSIRTKVEKWAENSNHTASILIREFYSSEDMLEEWERGMVMDIVFMDIQIPGELSGMEAAKIIYAQNPHVPIVFITNYSEYACEGYYVSALRFIKKPIVQEDIDECMNIVWRRWSNSNDESLIISGPKQTLRLPLKTVMYLESRGHYVYIRTTDETGQYEIRTNLNHFIAQLSKIMFVQCHRSYLINLMYVRKFQHSEIVLTDGEKIPIGKKFAREFVSSFQLYYQGVEPS